MTDDEKRAEFFKRFASIQSAEQIYKARDARDRKASK